MTCAQADDESVFCTVLIILSEKVVLSSPQSNYHSEFSAASQAVGILAAQEKTKGYFCLSILYISIKPIDKRNFSTGGSKVVREAVLNILQ